MTARALLATLFFALCLGSCEEQRNLAGPDQVVMELVGRLRRAHGSPETSKEIVDLLWKPARENLVERASRASALSGRELGPGEMLAPSWLSFHIVPEHYEWRAAGIWAEVRVLSAGGESVLTRCVREDGAWKVALELPPVPPIRRRDEPGLMDDQRRR